MLEAKLDALRPWGYSLGRGVYVVRFRAYREGSGVRLKASKAFAREAGITPRRCIVYVGGYSYECKLMVDEYVRIRLPVEIGSLILDGCDRADFWANVRVSNLVEVYECREPQRSLLEYVLGFRPFTGFDTSRSPSYGRGQRYCSTCRSAFYANLKKCPFCGRALRSSPKGGRRRKREKQYVDPERYGVKV